MRPFSHSWWLNLETASLIILIIGHPKLRHTQTSCSLSLSTSFGHFVMYNINQHHAESCVMFLPRSFDPTTSARTMPPSLELARVALFGHLSAKLRHYFKDKLGMFRVWNSFHEPASWPSPTGTRKPLTKRT